MTPCSLTKNIVAYGQPIQIGCDAQCGKAWGIHNRPKIQLSENPDDYAFFADSEVGEAPTNPGTYEGGCGKPQTESDRLNRWCFRECERCVDGKQEETLEAKDFSQRVFNIPQEI